MEIEIDCDDGKKMVEATEVQGTPFAVIKSDLLKAGSSVSQGCGYSITHVPSGRQIGPFGWYAESSAKQEVEAWWNRLTDNVKKFYRAHDSSVSLTARQAGLSQLSAASDFDFVDDVTLKN